MEITFNEAAQPIKTKKQFYNVLAKNYYMPKFDSKAITKDYLLKYIEDPIPIFFMQKEKVIHHHFRERKYTSIELFETLEALLKAKGLKPTGLDLLYMPDQDWLKNAILNVDPSDPYELLKKKKMKKSIIS